MNAVLVSWNCHVSFGSYDFFLFTKVGVVGADGLRLLAAFGGFTMTIASLSTVCRFLH